MKRFKLALLLVVSFFVSAEAMDSTSLEGNHLMRKIIENEGYCVQGYEGGKIFLNPSKVLLSREGPVLKLSEHESALLPVIQINGNGWFLEHGFASVSKLEKKSSKTEVCCACFEPVDNNKKCQNRRCQFYGFKVDTVER